SVSTHLSLIHPPLPHPHPHSFPTRRSSDLPPHRPHHHRPPRRRFSGRPQLRPTRLGDRPDRRRHLCRQLHPPQQDRHRLDLYPVLRAQQPPGPRHPRLPRPGQPHAPPPRYLRQSRASNRHRRPPLPLRPHCDHHHLADHHQHR